ncbi:hypothetical protein ASF22_02740 [Methylobacterium sp. Leaf87]|uniref:hypothetical protein n=1 Tax=Methylobacterium sp. Leaf87 TaxID=1736243 RepID=UPI0006FCD0A8|nr:hypothetical protein [Methylobacterium sp. Leaf87]KQO69544.1 hypothetical protein ASF22_02740 [Methylobacterium sp. Leaf87]
MAEDFASALRASAQRLNINPVDLGTVISYETGGTFDPWQKGPTTKWGQHRGLIQFGEPQRKQFGVYQGQSASEQLPAVEKYLLASGFKPGMGIKDLYSTINAGGPGRYNARDAAAGGAPGTVADKVEQQMAGHRAKAEKLLGGAFAPAAAQTQPTGGGLGEKFGQAPQAGTALADALPGATLPTGAFAIPVAVPDPAAQAYGQIAQQFTQRQQADATAESARRAALFGGGLGRLYG